MKNNKTIAILGGMGPQASTKLLEVLISLSSRDFGAKIDSDFPEFILDSVPVPNFVSDKENVKRALLILSERVKKLETFGPTCFAIACNTAHVMLVDLQNQTEVPFVSIIEEVTKRVVDTKLKRIGLMGSPIAINSGLFQKALAEQSIEVVIPSEKQIEILESIIRNILAGKVNKTDKERLLEISQSLEIRGAQGIVLGCTELPLIFPKNFPLPVFDSIEILARALLRKHYGRR